MRVGEGLQRWTGCYVFTDDLWFSDGTLADKAKLVDAGLMPLPDPTSGLNWSHLLDAARAFEGTQQKWSMHSTLNSCWVFSWNHNIIRSWPTAFNMLCGFYPQNLLLAVKHSLLTVTEWNTLCLFFFHWDINYSLNLRILCYQVHRIVPFDLYFLAQ